MKLGRKIAFGGCCFCPANLTDDMGGTVSELRNFNWRGLDLV